MKKVFVLLFIIYCLLFGLNHSLWAQDRYATCDLCGYCKDYVPTPPQRNPPTNWEQCRACLYENASTDPFSNETLKIGENNTPPTPIPGRWYALGTCIQTAGSFQQEGSASSLVAVLLNFVFMITGAIGLAYFIYGSFILLTSQAEPEKINQGKRIIYGAIIGIIITLSSVFLVRLITSGFLKIPGFGE